MDTQTGKLTPSDVTLLKRKGTHFEWVWSEDDNCDVKHYGGRCVGPGMPHGPNRNESKMLRHLCRVSGRTPEQVREVPKYKQMLAAASGKPKRPWWRKPDPYAGMTPEERDRAEVAKKLHMTVKHKHFEMLYARELRARKEEAKRREEQAIIDKLSIPW